MPPRKKNRDPFRRHVLGVKVVPASVPLCLCSHPKHRVRVGDEVNEGHEYDPDTERYGRCLHKACGCRSFRTGEPRPEVA